MLTLWIRQVGLDLRFRFLQLVLVKAFDVLKRLLLVYCWQKKTRKCLRSAHHIPEMCKNVPSVPTIQQMHRLSFLYKAALGTKSKTANSSKTTNHNHSGKRI